MNLFLDSIRRYSPISDEEGAGFLSFFKRRNYKKNTLLLGNDMVAHEVFFILKGGLRQFFFDEKGAEKSCNFAFEGDFLTDLESFSRQHKSTTQIITTEPAECLVVTCQDLAHCMKASPAVNTFVQILMEKVAYDNIRRIQALLSQSPEQQFNALIQDQPQILQRIPQRYIAQYLGIAPESLSRIRKRLVEAQKTTSQKS